MEVAQEDFITQDESDYALGRGSGYEHGALDVYKRQIIRTVPVVEKIIQSSPRRIQQKIPQKAQLRRHSLPPNAPAVSYTHLDVYKRQERKDCASCMNILIRIRWSLSVFHLRIWQNPVSRSRTILPRRDLIRCV